MADTDDALGELFAKLDPQIKAYQNKKALKKVDEILAISENDADALRCKVFLLIQESRFTDALAAMHGKSGLNLGMEKALQALKSIKDPSKTQAQLELQGQIQYRMGNQRDAFKTYQKLVGDLKVDSMEVKANLLAAAVAGKQSSDMSNMSSSFGIKSSDGLEVVFNKACGLIETGDYPAAKEQLELALREGRETLFMDDLPESEIDLELLPVSLQLAYVNGLLGMNQDALDGYKTVLNTKGIDQNQRVIAEHNVFAQKSVALPDQPQKKVIEDGLKKVGKLLDESSVARLSPLQKCIAMCNHALLLLLAGKWEGAKDTLSSLARGFPNDDRVNMVKVSLLTKEQKFSEAEKVASDLAAAPGAQLYAILMRAQLLAVNGNLEEAIGLLSGMKDPSVKNSGAMVATQAALLEKVGDFQKCQSLIEDALEWWRGEGSKDQKIGSAACSWCLEWLATLKLREQSLDAASRLYRDALDVQLDEVLRTLIVSKLSRVLAVTDPSAVKALESELRPVRDFTSAEIDKLEGSTTGTRRKDEGSRKRPIAEGTAKLSVLNGIIKVDSVPHLQEKRKRVRKPRYPKDFDPKNPGPKPDPERWMPKWQRSGHKKSRRRRRDEKEMKGSQGAGKVNENLDRTKATGNDSASSGRTQSSKPQRPGGAGKRRSGRK